MKRISFKRFFFPRKQAKVLPRYFIFPEAYVFHC